MRSRKPCVFARRRLFGWNVRLLTTTPTTGEKLWRNVLRARSGDSRRVGQPRYVHP
jgi:hypothetical protein